jgi:anti-sigma factor RsiW
MGPVCGEGGMLTCKDTIELLSDYLDGDLPPRERLSLEAHLSACTACVEYIESLRATQSMVRELREKDLPEEVGKALRAFLDRERGGRRS